MANLLRPDFYDSLMKIPGKTFQDKLNVLNNCNCCERHQIGKPKNFIPWDEKYERNVELYLQIPHDKLYTCECDCRSKARWICRKHPEYTGEYTQDDCATIPIPSELLTCYYIEKLGDNVYQEIRREVREEVRQEVREELVQEVTNDIWNEKLQEIRNELHKKNELWKERYDKLNQIEEKYNQDISKHLCIVS